MNKVYFNKEGLSEFERNRGRVSYDTLVDFFIGDVFSCNKIMEVDEFLFDNIIVSKDDIDIYQNIYQAYLCNVDQFQIEKLKELNSEYIILAYSQLLDTDVLLVPHCGTSWKYVLTDIEIED